MTEVVFEMTNVHGLHARPASLFSSTAMKFTSDIKVTKLGKSMIADGKSVLSVLMLEVYPGSTITISIDGEDEDQAMEALTSLIESNFGDL